MKKILAVIIALVATVALAAPASATSSSLSRKDKDFVTWVRKAAPVFQNYTATGLVRIAKEQCQYFNSGTRESTVASWMIEDSGFTQREATVFIGAAIGTYCPRHGGDNIK